MSIYLFTRTQLLAHWPAGQPTSMAPAGSFSLFIAPAGSRDWRYHRTRSAIFTGKIIHPDALPKTIKAQLLILGL